MDSLRGALFVFLCGGRAEHHLSTGSKHPGYIFLESDGVDFPFFEQCGHTRPRQQSGENAVFRVIPVSSASTEEAVSTGLGFFIVPIERRRF